MSMRLPPAWLGAQFIAALQLAAGRLSIHCDDIAHIWSDVQIALEKTLSAGLSTPEFVVIRSALVAFVCRAAASGVLGISVDPKHLFDLADAGRDGVVAAFVASVRFSDQGGRARRQSTADSRVVAVLHLLHDHVAERLTITSLARSVGITRWHLARLLKQHTGCTFREHVKLARLRQAEALLSEPGRSVKEVSAAVGYGNRNAFSKHFRREFGLSPRAWASQAAIEHRRPSVPFGPRRGKS